MAITCPACNYDCNPEGAQFCEACGHELSQGNSQANILYPDNPPPEEPEPDAGNTINIYPPSPPPVYPAPTTVQSSPAPTYPAQTNVSYNFPPTVISSGTTARLIPKQAGSPVPEIILDSSSAIIGRFDPDTGPVEVDLEGFHGDETVSRNHGEIYLERGQWQIKDIGSINGIFIKPAGQTRFGPKITMPSTLNPGDEIAIGKVRLLFQIP
ncbi:MAG: FHA domain-containing protein [Hormoscilla sp. GM102CHS1]|nr:FHA domain-containing protein [Hormoscilla sp. GM102CHS1]